jgi:hypothetical protein
MRRCRGLFRLLGTFSRHQFSADYTITMFRFDFREGQGQESGAYGVIGATQTKLERTSHSSRGEVRKPMTSRSDLAAFIAHELSKSQHDRDPVRFKCLREWCH